MISVKAAFLLSLLMTSGMETMDATRLNREDLQKINQGRGPNEPNGHNGHNGHNGPNGPNGPGLKSQAPQQRTDCRVWQRVSGSDLKDFIQLNVGGYHYVAHRSTMTQTPWLQRLLEGQVDVDEWGAVFIDRDGSSFDGVLTWLRTQNLVHSQKPDKEEELWLRRLQSDAEYFGMDLLFAAVGEALALVKPVIEEHVEEKVVVLNTQAHNPKTTEIEQILKDGWRIKAVGTAAYTTNLISTFVLERTTRRDVSHGITD